VSGVIVVGWDETSTGLTSVLGAIVIFSPGGGKIEEYSMISCGGEMGIWRERNVGGM
jgi:hypothetical protein